MLFASLKCKKMKNGNNLVPLYRDFLELIQENSFFLELNM
jgi:hypothetical protein